MRASLVSGLLLIILCIPAHAHAQVRFGVSAEMNRSTFAGVPPGDANFSSNYGAGFAGIVEFRIHHDVVLSIQPGWSQKGSKIVFNEEEPDSVETFAIEQSWATIPVYFRIDSDGRGFYAGGGLSLDILLESELEHRGATDDNKDAFDEIDAVYQFTAGYLHDTGSVSLFLEARYRQGIRTITRENEGVISDVYVPDVKSNGLGLVAGILF